MPQLNANRSPKVAGSIPPLQRPGSVRSAQGDRQKGYSGADQRGMERDLIPSSAVCSQRLIVGDILGLAEGSEVEYPGPGEAGTESEVGL